MFVNDDVLAKGREPNSLFVFVHCQRTGGSNLQRWFRRVFPDDEVYSQRTTKDGYTPWHQLGDPRVLDDKRMAAGFTYFVPRDIGRPVVALANVRHPFYRMVSLYRMSQTHKNHWMHEIAKVSSLDEFYRKGAASKTYYFNNLLCRRIGNITNADAAIEAMHKYFGLVGTTNRLVDTTSKLIETYDWTVDPIKETGRPPDDVNYEADAKSSIYDEIMTNNAEDAKLYDYVMRQGG